MKNKLLTNQEKIEFPVNEQINSDEVRIVGGKSETELTTYTKAIEMAEKMEVDLIQITESKGIPVCRLERIDKFLYDQKKSLKNKQKGSRESSKKNAMKELQVRVGIDPHDLKIKINQAKNFINKGKKVKWVLRFFGREITHIDKGEAVLAEIESGLIAIASAAETIKEGRVWYQVWSAKN